MKAQGEIVLKQLEHEGLLARLAADDQRFTTLMDAVREFKAAGLRVEASYDFSKGVATICVFDTESQTATVN
jgi:hypothetical protein